MDSGALQLSLFDQRDLASITAPDFPGERLVVCRNPDLAAERTRKREELLVATERDLARTGGQVDFFGEPTRMPAGPAKLAINTGAALVPVHCWYDGDDCRVMFGPPLDCASGDVGVVTQALADVFARNIAEHPADWHMLQPQWLADLSDERRARLAET